MGTKTCAQGHKYDDSKPECPFCPKPDFSHKKTVLDEGGFAGEEPGLNLVQPNKVPNKGTRIASPGSGTLGNGMQSGGKKGTRIAIDSAEPSSQVLSSQPARAVGKLIGWVVSFSWNPQGDDHRIREGRTRIGSDPSMDIVVNDGLVSGKHAILIYRSGKLKIRDEMSVNGTFVNDEDIGDDPTIIKDGDLIRFGTGSEFKLRLIDIEEESS